jgi:uridine kinase
MKRKQITITVAGETASGKSRVLFLLKKVLKDNGFIVEFDGGIDFENETQFDEVIGKNLDTVIDALKDSRIISLREEQTKANYFPN